MRNLATRLGLLVGTALLSCINGSAWAQNWPQKPIRLIVGYAAGGTADIIARKVQSALGSQLGQSIIVENRVGASGAIATAEIARSTDSHTLGLAVSTHASLPAISRKLPFDTLKDIQPVAFIGKIPLILVVRSDLPAKSLREVIDLAKTEPKKFNLAFPGIGATHHFAAEMLKLDTGVDFALVAYRGSAPALTDLVARQVDMTFATTPSVRQFIDSGAVRAVASTGSRRSLPTIPTFIEEGHSNFEISEWFGIVAPASMPRDITVKIHAAVKAAIEDPNFVSWGQDNALQIEDTSPEYFQKFIVSEVDKFTDIAKRADIKME